MVGVAWRVAVLMAVPKQHVLRANNLLVEGLGVGGGGRDVGVTGSLVGASSELELVGSLGVAGLASTGVVLKIEKLGEHCGFFNNILNPTPSPSRSKFLRPEKDLLHLLWNTLVQHN